VLWAKVKQRSAQSRASIEFPRFREHADGEKVGILGHEVAAMSMPPFSVIWVA
jgi:hypothetical protein